MDLLDQRVIGYETTKEILRQILDILSHRSTYEIRGAAIPHGLLMVSEPGLGKSLMAGAFMEESGRNCTVFHKNSDGEGAVAECKNSAAAFLKFGGQVRLHVCGKLFDFLGFRVQQTKPCPKSSASRGCIVFARG